MHRFFQRRVDIQTWTAMAMFWTLAPSLPLVVGTMARVSLASIDWQRSLINWTALALIPVLAALSFWGAAQIKSRLKSDPMKDWGLVGPPLCSLLLVGTAGVFARWLSGKLPDDWGGAFGEYGAFLLVWAALVAQQMKYFWEHTLEAWENRRADFMPGVPRFNILSRWLARRALADRQARAWLERRKTRLTAVEREVFRQWRRIPVKAGGWRRQGYGMPRWVIYGTVVACAAMIVSYGFHMIWTRP